MIKHITLDPKQFECRGRNGWFQAAEVRIYIPEGDSADLLDGVADIEIHSSRHGQTAPIMLRAHPQQLINLLTTLLGHLTAVPLQIGGATVKEELEAVQSAIDHAASDRKTLSNFLGVSFASSLVNLPNTPVPSRLRLPRHDQESDTCLLERAATYAKDAGYYTVETEEGLLCLRCAPFAATTRDFVYLSILPPDTCYNCQGKEGTR
jgi:hypothetical protein